MEPLTDIQVAVLLTINLTCAFSSVRMAWLSGQRVELLKRDFKAYRKAPCYYSMFFRVWVWDINKFNNGDK